MKKLLLSLLLTFSISSSYAALDFYELSKKSFKLNDSLLIGSDQWVDLKLLQPYYSMEPIVIAIQNLNSTQGTIVISTYLKFAVKNTDGTYRVNFKLPTNYMLGKFKLTINECYGEYNAILTDKVTTGIDDEQLGTQATRTYYDILGNQVIPIEGLYIWRDTKGLSGKEYISK